MEATYTIQSTTEDGAYAVVTMPDGSTFGVNAPAGVSKDALDALVLAAIARNTPAETVEPVVAGETHVLSVPSV